MIKYIFSVNASRCGTNYLTGLLQHCTGVAALHEAEPVLNGKPMIQFLEGDQSLLKSLMDEKAKQIEIAKGENKVYVETNHCFIKGFGWLIMDKIPKEEIGIIVIKRPKEQIVKSLYKIDCSPINSFGRNWLFTPFMKNPIIKLNGMNKTKHSLYSFLLRYYVSKYNTKLLNFKKPKFIKDYELKLLDWHVDETYAQGERFIKENSTIKVFETETQKLNNVSELEKMFKIFDLDIEIRPSIQESLNKPTNLKTETKKFQNKEI